MSSNTETFTVSVVGEITGEKWSGVFKTKLKLCHRDQFRQDEIRRELLGNKPEFANPRTQNSADVFSFIAVHIVEAPSWWTSHDNGLTLDDDAPVAAVFEGILAAKQKYLAERKKAAEAAKADLSKHGG